MKKDIFGKVLFYDGKFEEMFSCHLDAVLQAVELPAGIGHLTARLADVDGDAFPHFKQEEFRPDT